jgi:lincosamide nucleotidyltransferase A/C/D/E
VYGAEEVLRVLALLDRAGCAVWVGGGWGIDALVGRVTREHADLDLMHRLEQEAVVITTLQTAGYTEISGISPGRPVRFVMADPAGHQIDLHPLAFAPDGSATQCADEHGGVFRYPADCFTTGTIGGLPVRCLTAEQQAHFHHGYQPRPQDRHDMAELRRAFGIATHF